MSALAPQRRAQIAEQVQLTGGVRVSELTRLFGVSDMTIRRDLDSLARRGLIAKVHGGAIRADPSRRSQSGLSKVITPSSAPGRMNTPNSVAWPMQ